MSISSMLEENHIEKKNVKYESTREEKEKGKDEQENMFYIKVNILGLM